MVDIAASLGFVVAAAASFGFVVAVAASLGFVVVLLVLLFFLIMSGCGISLTLPVIGRLIYLRPTGRRF